MQKPVMDGKPPRFFHLFLQPDLIAGWNLTTESGYQGASGQVRQQHFESWEAAEQAMLGRRDAHIRRGYRVMFVQGQEPPP